MMGVLDVLGSLGAEKLRDGSWKLELDQLRLHSVFGGSIAGAAVVVVAGDAVSFQTPPELLACGKMSMAGVVDVDGLRNAIAEAHGQVRERVSEGVTSLRRLGFKAKLTPPEPRARGYLEVDKRAVVVGLDPNGDLVVEEVAGRALPPDQRRALIAPDEATAPEAQRRVTSLVQAFWKRQGTGAGATSAAAPPLSQGELDELSAALGEDSLDPVADEFEQPTKAGAHPPLRERSPSARFAVSHPNPSHLSDEQEAATVGARAAAPAITAREEDDDVGTLELRAPPRIVGVPSPKQRDSGSLLDAFDDEPDPDHIEHTATTTKPAASPASANQFAVLLSVMVPSATGEAENDLLAAFDDAAAPPIGDQRPDFDDFPAFDGDASLMNGSPTSVNAPPSLLPSLPSAAPTHPSLVPQLKRTSVEDEADGFDDGEGKIKVTAAAGPRPLLAQAASDDDLDDEFEVKTRALSVDQALLDRLKVGAPGDAATVETPRPSPTNPKQLATAPALVLSPPPSLAAGVSVDGLGASDPPRISVEDPRVEAEIASLSLRAEELAAELASVHARLAVLQAARESTATHPGGSTDRRPTNVTTQNNNQPTATSPPAKGRDAAAPPPANATPPRAPKPRTGEFRTVGQSLEGSGEGETGGRAHHGGTSLPSLASVDVQQLADRDSSAGEDGVSLADLQGALQGLDANVVEAGATQVAASELPIELNNDDGDVFGSSAGAAEAPELSFAKTRLRSSVRPSSIALVVEDPKARDRLRKHLEPRFGELLEAENARAIAQMKELSRLDAIVFVRPSSSELNRQGFTKLHALPRRPRVLVISADLVFDNLPGVDLRLPLGQKASEVARQVVEGLERLGVSLQQV